MAGRTTVVVAHRLSTAARADRIGVVYDGRLTELGTHDELVGAGGHYAELYRAWASHQATPDVA
jgi:ATP-binding cassette subfamily C protein